MYRCHADGTGIFFTNSSREQFRLLEETAMIYSNQ